METPLASRNLLPTPLENPETDIGAFFPGDRDGVEVASAPGGAQHLHETGLPVRYYLPATAVDAGRLRASATTTECPYKGVANYYSLVVGAGTAEERTLRDVVWYYRNPTHESARVAGLLCFYNEKVDIELDGTMLERPKTIFS